MQDQRGEVEMGKKLFNKAGHRFRGNDVGITRDLGVVRSPHRRSAQPSSSNITFTVRAVFAEVLATMADWALPRTFELKLDE